MKCQRCWHPCAQNRYLDRYPIRAHEHRPFRNLERLFVAGHRNLTQPYCLGEPCSSVPSIVHRTFEYLEASAVENQQRRARNCVLNFALSLFGHQIGVFVLGFWTTDYWVRNVWQNKFEDTSCAFGQQTSKMKVASLAAQLSSSAARSANVQRAIRLRKAKSTNLGLHREIFSTSSAQQENPVPAHGVHTQNSDGRVRRQLDC